MTNLSGMWRVLKVMDEEILNTNISGPLRALLLQSRSVIQTLIYKSGLQLDDLGELDEIPSACYSWSDEQ